MVNTNIEIKLGRGYQSLVWGVFFMLSGVMFEIFQSLTATNTPTVRYLIYFFSLFYFCKGIYLTRETSKYKNVIKFFVFVYLTWSIISMLRGIPKIAEGYENFIYLKRLLSGDLIIYILPFLILIKPNLLFYKTLMKYAYKMTLIGCITTPFIFVLFKTNTGYGIELFSRFFTASGAIILLTSYYHTRQKLNITILSTTITLFILILLARRNMIVYFAAVLSFSILINLFSKYKNKKNSIIYLFVIWFFVGMLFILFSDFFSFAITRFNTGFESRSDVITEFVEDFDTTPIDWIFGRGLYGEFHTNTLALNKITNTRDGIENGYLNHILIGGWIYLIALIAISFPAIYLGFFKSKNILSKAFAAIILIYFIDMIGFGLPNPHIKYLIIFIALSGCYSYDLRNVSDTEIKNKLNFLN